MRTTVERRNIVAVYSRLAFVYDAWTWATERKSLLAGLSHASIHDGDAVLEVAVGTGLVFREVLLRNPSGRNVGIDLTEAMLRRARRKAEGTRVPFSLEIGDARNMTFASDTFDVVLNNNMLGLLRSEDVAPALGEMLRVLRPGGRLVLVTMIRPDRHLAGWIYELGAKRLGAWREVQVEPLVRAAGFEQEQREVVTQIGVPSEILVAQKPTTP